MIKIIQKIQLYQALMAFFEKLSEKLGRNSLGGTGFESIRWQIQQAKAQIIASKGL